MGVNGSDEFETSHSVSKAYVIDEIFVFKLCLIIAYWIQKLINLIISAVLKKIGVDAFNVVFVFFVSLSLFPGMTYSIKSLNYLPDRQDLYSVILVVSALNIIYTAIYTHSNSI